MIDIESWPLAATSVDGANPVNTGGTYFKLRTPPAAVNVQLYRNGELITRCKGAVDAVKAHIPGGFTSWAAQFVSGAGGSITVGVGDEDFDIDSQSGTVQSIALGGSGIQDSADVVTAGGPGNKVALIAANASRRTLLVRSHQGNNAAGVRIGADATVAADHGQELYPGESVALDTQGAVSVWNLTIGDKFNITEILA